MNPEEQAAVSFFLRQSMALARRMPLPEARQYLHGLLISFPDNAPEIAEAEKAFRALCTSDDLLAKIAGGQMELTFKEDAP